jgi:prepilin-type N-terminal cleavage/methylation domain-containing protein
MARILHGQDKMKTKKYSGFTIVELLIVIVVIAILAAITVVIFNGVQNRAKTSASIAGLTQISKKIATWQVENSDQDAVPDCVTFATQIGSVRNSDDDCVSVKDGITYQYSQLSEGGVPTGYCITATNGTINYKMTNTSSPVSGGCAGHGLSGVPPITNLVTNPSFEVNTADWSGNGASITRSVAESRTGAASVQVIANANNNNYGLTSALSMLPAQTGQVFSVSAWVKADPGIKLALRSDEYDGGTYIRGDSQPFTTNGEWQRVSLTTQPISAGTSLKVYVRMYNETVTRTYYVDDVMVVNGGVLYPYADGSTSGWIWKGATHNSRSTGPPL